MPRASKVCPHPTCPNLQGQCDKHDRKPWQGSLRRSRTVSGGRQQKRARFVMQRDGTICHVCGNPGSDEVDHVIPLAVEARLPEHRSLPLSLVDHVSNMAPIHKDHHAQKTAEEARRARGIETAQQGVPILVIAGLPGVGKSTVCAGIREQMRCVLADSTGGWPSIYTILGSSPLPVVVECSRLPRRLRSIISARPTFVVELTAPREVRTERLLGRGETQARVEELLFEDADGLDLGYEDAVPVDLVVLTEKTEPMVASREIAASFTVFTQEEARRARQ